MSEKAQVSSIDALKAFRTNLIVYVSKARPTVEEVSGEITRIKTWLERDQRFYWENEVRKRTKEVERTQAAVFGSKLSNSRGAGMAEQMAYRKAKAGLDAAAEKLRRVKQWDRDFENRVAPLVKQLEKVHTVLSLDLTQAIVYLAEVTRTLDAYADIHVTNPDAPAAAAPPADTPAGATAPADSGGET